MSTIQMILFSDPSNQRRPVVIVDILACIRPVYGDLDMICGGQGKLYKERWSIFIKAFESAGIELVFVTNESAVPENKRYNWTRSKYGALKTFVFPIFDRLVKAYVVPLKTLDDYNLLSITQ